jgi:hypothetical protein
MPTVGNAGRLARRLLYLSLRLRAKSSRDSLCEEVAMRFHVERDKRLHPIRDVQIDAPPSSNRAFVMRRYGTSGQLPFTSKRAASLTYDERIVDDSPMIAMCYEAHLSMQSMLAAFAEARGDGDAPAGPNL